MGRGGSLTGTFEGVLAKNTTGVSAKCSDVVLWPKLPVFVAAFLKKGEEKSSTSLQVCSYGSMKVWKSFGNWTKLQGHTESAGIRWICINSCNLNTVISGGGGVFFPATLPCMKLSSGLVFDTVLCRSFVCGAPGVSVRRIQLFKQTQIQSANSYFS